MVPKLVRRLLELNRSLPKICRCWARELERFLKFTQVFSRQNDLSILLIKNHTTFSYNSCFAQSFEVVRFPIQLSNVQDRVGKTSVLNATIKDILSLKEKYDLKLSVLPPPPPPKKKDVLLKGISRRQARPEGMYIFMYLADPTLVTFSSESKNTGNG